MKERERQTAGTFSGGGQEMLAVVKDIFTIIQTTNQQGITALLIEQNANMALKVPHKAYVIETGKITMEAPARNCRRMKKAKGPTLARQNNDAILKNPAWHKAACVKKTVGVFVQTPVIARRIFWYTISI